MRSIYHFTLACRGAVQQLPCLMSRRKNRRLPGKCCLIASLVLAITSMFASAAAPEIAVAVPDAAPAGFERTNIEGGWRFTSRYAITDPTELRLGTFPAKRAQPYAIKLTISGQGEALSQLTIQSRWLDAQGKNAGERDQQLGYGDPTLSATTLSDWTGAAVTLQMEGKSSLTGAERGELVFTIAKLGKGSVIEIRNLSISESAETRSVQQQKTVELQGVPNDKGSLFFSEESRTPEVKVSVRNLLAAKQEIVLAGKIRDFEGNQVGSVEAEISLASQSAQDVELKVPTPGKFGVYLIELEAIADGKSVGSGQTRFAWLPRPTQTDEVRLHELYPFDMHPSAPLLTPDGNPNVDLAKVDYQARLLRRMGVRGIRLQNYLFGLNFNDQDASVAAVRQRIETWRKTVWPILQKHGIEVWVSIMEQDPRTIPRTPEQFRVWRAYIREQTRAFGDIPKFYLFGNEGMGGHTPADLDTKISLNALAFPADTSAREWLATYEATYEAAKEGNPNCLFGPSHSSDAAGNLAQAFIKMFGKNGKADIWGNNSYANTAETMKTIHDKLQSAGYSPKFGVVPEVGINAPHAGAMHISLERKQMNDMVQTCLTTLTSGWVKRIDWFIFSAGGSNLLSVYADDWTPRPVAGAWVVMADTLRAGKMEKLIKLPGGGEFFVWRRIDNTIVGVGMSPVEKVITLDVGGADEIEISDVFGNRQKRRTAKGIFTLPLSSEPVYVLGAPSLDESKALEVNIVNATQEAEGPNRVAVNVRNNTADPQKITITGQPTPQASATPAQAEFEIKPGQSVASVFQVDLPDYNDRVRSKVGFKVSNNDYLAFETKVNDTFARCVQAAVPPAFDGTWKGWERAQTLHADQAVQVEEANTGKWHGPDDLSAVFRLMWDDQFLYIGAETTDDIFVNEQPSDRMFLQDAIEMGFDFEHSLTNDAPIWQFMAGKLPEGIVVKRFVPRPVGMITSGRVAVHPSGIKGGTIYQVAIPWSECGNFKPAIGKQIGVGLIADDGDGKAGDRRFITWFGFGVHVKKPNELGDLIFVK